MNIFLTFVALVGATCVIGQEKGNSIIPFPRVGRSGGMSPGLIPFPRVGRAGEGFQKRQLIPFPRVGKRFPMPFPMYMDPFYAEYETPYSPWVDASDAMLATTASSDKDDSNLDIDKKSAPNAPNAGSGMWFGPRLGRKKRSIDSSSEGSSEHSTLDTRTLVKILHNFNWAIVPIKERRTFTPRLGRGSGEISVHTRAQPLTPRLGRSQEVVTEDVEEDAPHYHTVHTKSTQQPPIDVSGPPFSPRLGRADHYSPRLGRSGEDQQ